MYSDSISIAVKKTPPPALKKEKKNSLYLCPSLSKYDSNQFLCAGLIFRKLSSLQIYFQKVSVCAMHTYIRSNIYIKSTWSQRTTLI